MTRHSKALLFQVGPCYLLEGNMYGYGFQYSTITGGDSQGQIIFEAYKIRVIADGGVVENNNCAIREINKLI